MEEIVRSDEASPILHVLSLCGKSQICILMLKGSAVLVAPTNSTKK
jgi:hypothetical protein